jgi:hypothetical protein
MTTITTIRFWIIRCCFSHASSFSSSLVTLHFAHSYVLCSSFTRHTQSGILQARTRLHENDCHISIWKFTHLFNGQVTFLINRPPKDLLIACTDSPCTAAATWIMHLPVLLRTGCGGDYLRCRRWWKMHRYDTQTLAFWQINMWTHST